MNNNLSHQRNLSSMPSLIRKYQNTNFNVMPLTVENFIPKVVILKLTLEPTQGRNPIHANMENVEKNLPDLMNCPGIREFTPVKNRSNVNSAKNLSQEQTI